MKNHMEKTSSILLLALCPALAVTTTAMSGLAMGITVLAVLILSNAILSSLRNFLSEESRLPASLILTALLAAAVQLLMQAYTADISEALGIYLPLTIASTLLCGRANEYALKNPVLPAVADGLKTGIGFTVSVTVLGLVRELIGAGTCFGHQVMPDFYQPVAIFVKAPGAFLTLALLLMIRNAACAADKEGGEVR